MTIATKRLTFEEYLTYNDGTDTRYELVNGELVKMGIGEGLHGEIMYFLEQRFNLEIQRLGRTWVARKAVIGLRSPRAGRWDTSRIPDVTVLPEEQWRSLRNREAIIELNEPPPLIVVEVVSETTRMIDYRAKRSEYSVLNIPEYWVVDPLAAKITIFTLVEGFYEAEEFSDNDQIQSPTFPELNLTAIQILSAESR